MHTSHNITTIALNGAPTCLVVLHRGHKERVKTVGEGRGRKTKSAVAKRDTLTNQDSDATSGVWAALA